MFFHFQNHLRKRSEYYLEKYGIIPSFKGAINAGVVSTVEIGSDVKSEIAFHGDVVNTTARVMEFWKIFNEDLLITEEMMSRTHLAEKEFNITMKDQVLLRGKNKKQKIFAINCCNYA